MNENSNFLFAIVLSLGVLIGWQYFVIAPKEAAQREALAQQAATEQPLAPLTTDPLALNTPGAPQLEQAEPEAAKRTSLKNAPRVSIKSDQMKGSISLLGARFDDISLTQYPVSLKEGSPSVTLLRPETEPKSWQAQFGWQALPGAELDLPNDQSQWALKNGATLAPDNPVTLEYKSKSGLVFTRTISVDHEFMFTIDDQVQNISASTVTLFPYGQIIRTGRPKTSNLFVLHEGPIGLLGEEGLQELDYADLLEDGPTKITSQGGWLGFTDKYWATALIPPQDVTVNARFVARGANQPENEVFKSDYILDGRAIAPGQISTVSSRLFAGAKVVDVIDNYANQGIDRFDLLIDWGWFYFLTKPMFAALQFFYHLLGNYGLSILLVTVIIKLLFFPLASRSYVTMAKMKRVQPEMVRIREVYKDDRQAQQQQLMKLYKDEKLNPLAGCLPVLLQIPVFFALYKVLFVTLDMRHQPFFGWVQDLAAPDPTTLFNLFGLIPWDPPSFLMLGVWPLLMGITMFVQMQLNPPPPDPVQAMIFKYMPIFFTFLLAGFPAGLVIYWAWNNFLSILQQSYIMQRNGAEIELLNNIGLRKKQPEESK